MEPCRLTVHPIYGAIYKDGEFAQRGAILGLNAEANGVVIAPLSGWVRVVRALDAENARQESLFVEIWEQTAPPGLSPASRSAKKPA